MKMSSTARTDLAPLPLLPVPEVRGTGGKPGPDPLLISPVRGGFQAGRHPERTPPTKLGCPMTFGDRVRLKRCSSCGRSFSSGEETHLW